MTHPRSPLLFALLSLPALADCSGQDPPPELFGGSPATAGATAGESSGAVAVGTGGSGSPQPVSGGVPAFGNPTTPGATSAGAPSESGGVAGADTKGAGGDLGAAGAPEDPGGGGTAEPSAGTAGQASGSGSGGAGARPLTGGTCETLPAPSDYGAPGPFADARMFPGAGPNSDYTLFRPDASLGRDGFKHPIVTWGNGIATTPDMYAKTLTFLATHGFVIIACNATQAERACVAAGLDWLASQNESGPMQGKLDVKRELAVGYSWGGGAVIDASDRPNIKATVSLHGMPPRGTNAFAAMHAPLLLFTSTGDTFVSATQYVTPNYEQSTVQTFYATLDDRTAGHLYVADEGASVCLGAALGLGTCANAVAERGPTVAWFRYWACNDQNAKSFFFGDDCVLCQSPWTDPRRKEWN